MSAAERRMYVLGSETHRQFVGSLVATSPAGCVVTLDPPRRTVDQNRLLHALITEAVEGGFATDSGRRLTVTEAKTAFVTGWMDETGQSSDMVMVGGRPVQLRRSTTELNKAELSELVEYIYAECALRGIQFRSRAEDEPGGIAR